MQILTSSPAHQFVTASSNQATSAAQETWFDALDHVELQESWFDAEEGLDSDPLATARDRADRSVPFTEDCRRATK